LLRIYYSTPLAPTYLYTLSLHDALPILSSRFPDGKRAIANRRSQFFRDAHSPATPCRGTILPGLQFLGWRISSDARNADERRPRSEEHTSELQSPYDLVCRLLLEKKKNK